MTNEKITAFKGFDKDMKCRGFQYEVGKTYEHEGVVEACRAGFHACENPFDVWSYYDIHNSRFAAVTMHGETSKDGRDSKIASGKITIEAEISMPEYARKCVDWVIEKTKGKNDSGDSAQIGSSGDYAKIGSSGYYAQIGSSGDSAQIGSSGDYAKIGSSGDYAKIGSSGDSAQISVEGKRSVVASSGCNATVRGVDGTWVAIAEYNESGECVGFATGCIGKDGLEAGVTYKAKGGKLVKCDE